VVQGQKREQEKADGEILYRRGLEPMKGTAFQMKTNNNLPKHSNSHFYETFESNLYRCAAFA
jgi:hypothetical protein